MNVLALLTNKSAFSMEFTSLRGNEDLNQLLVALISSLQRAMECSVSRISLCRLSSMASRSLSSA